LTKSPASGKGFPPERFSGGEKRAMSRTLYDLAAADGRRFSPYCWRAKLALAHKGLDVVTVPVGFTEIRAIPGGGQTTVPVLDDGGRVVRDSFAIAEYLEDAYPDRPSLFGGEGGRGVARLIEGWSFTLQAQISGLVTRDIWAGLKPQDQAYFRTSREARLGRTLEAAQAGREERLEPFRKSLQPLRHALQHAPFIGGKTPLFGDYILFGTLQWPRVASDVALLAEDDPVAAWFAAIADLYGGRGNRVMA
jgi:glutathione S-transferase